MKNIWKRLVIIILVLFAIIAIGLGLYLFVTRPSVIDYLSIDNGPFEMSSLMDQQFRYGNTLDAIRVRPQGESGNKRNKLIDDKNLSVEIINSGVGIETNSNIDWDVTFHVDPLEDQYGFTSEWTLHL